jgi:hypothetical protein
VCTKIEEILEEGGKIEEDLVEDIVYTVYCANAYTLLSNLGFTVFSIMGLISLSL